MTSVVSRDCKTTQTKEMIFNWPFDKSLSCIAGSFVMSDNLNKYMDKFIVDQQDRGLHCSLTYEV